MKAVRTWLIRVLVGKREAEHTALMERIPAPVVVLGFPRSGTSMVAQLLSSAGYFFGDSKESMKPDLRNPKGYFEHGPLFRLSRTFLREAGVMGDLDPAPYGLGARGLVNRLRRAFTRRDMMATLDLLAEKPPFGVKLFPRFYYFWKQYLPASTQIIAIYREPMAVANSFLAAWPGGRYSIDQVLTFWAEHNRDLLFQLRESGNAVLLKYEDLLDPEVRPGILAALEKKSGIALDASLVDAGLNRSTRTEAGEILSADAQNVLQALEAAKLQPDNG